MILEGVTLFDQHLVDTLTYVESLQSRVKQQYNGNNGWWHFYSPVSGYEWGQAGTGPRVEEDFVRFEHTGEAQIRTLDIFINGTRKAVSFEIDSLNAHFFDVDHFAGAFEEADHGFEASVDLSIDGSTVIEIDSFALMTGCVYRGGKMTHCGHNDGWLSPDDPRFDDGLFEVSVGALTLFDSYR